jgi:hypothetical protein
MIFERAYKACELCEKYNSLIYNPKERREIGDSIGPINLHTLRNAATFEAMSALETVASRQNVKEEEILQANRLLDSCKNCDYEGKIRHSE